MSTTIQAIKIQNVVNISIAGKLYKKNCGSEKEADELYKLVLTARENPTPENIRNVKIFLNEKIRIAYLTGLESDIETGEIYLAGFNTPVPQTLIDVIKEYHEKKYPLEAILNFWSLLMLNPDKRVRTSLFDFIKQHDFVLTDKGYMVVYKAVFFKEVEDKLKPYMNFIQEKYLHVLNTWKTKPNRYVVYKNLSDDNSFGITKSTTAAKWNEKEKNIEILGNLDTIYNALHVDNKRGVESTQYYTDMYTRKMTIEVGVPVKQERAACDGNQKIECSQGLHVGATKYVEKYGSNNSRPTAILVCLVNPANVVAVPDYDKSKMRTCEYFPFAVAKYENNKIEIIEECYYEDDYSEYEVKELEAQLAKVKSEELPIEKAKNAEAETRPMAELLKMIESRLVEIK